LSLFREEFRGGNEFRASRGKIEAKRDGKKTSGLGIKKGKKGAPPSLGPKETLKGPALVSATMKKKKG